MNDSIVIALLGGKGTVFLINFVLFLYKKLWITIKTYTKHILPPDVSGERNTGL